MDLCSRAYGLSCKPTQYGKVMTTQMPHEQRKQPPLVWEGVMPHTVVNSPMTPYQVPKNHGLYKLVLTVAQACNLRCTYCYAEGGPYGKDVSRMSEETARQAIRKMFTDYSPIRTLQFFGGEPTLNLSTMKAAVDEVRSMIMEQAITTPPRFAIVTNALRMTNELVNFYADSDMMITVSHDGPAEVHDALRPGLRGETSFDTVDANLKRLKDAGIAFDVQCTYTRKHILAGYRVPNLLKYFHDIGAQSVHIVPVTVPKGHELDIFFSEYFSDMVQGYREAVQISFRAMLEGRKLRFGMLEEAVQLLKPGKTESKHYCNAGVTTLTIAANGDIYPCFMFINKQGFQMGHVNGDHALAAFARDPKHGVDFGCPGRQFMMSGEIAPFHPDEVLKQAVVDEVLTCLSEFLNEAEADLGINRN